MLVSIITVCYNGEATISRAIESVLNQTYGEIEYLIIDGASTDHTVEVARSYIPMFEERVGRKLVVLSEPDAGMYDALNKGSKIVHGELVGNINADDWYEPDAVEKMVALYKETNYDVAWGSLNVLKPTGNMVKHAHIGKIWTTLGWCHPGMFAKREVLKEYPYACENMYDDFEFITHVYKAGKKLITSNEVIANYSFGGMSTKKDWGMTKKRIGYLYRIYRKYDFSRMNWFHCAAKEVVKYLMA